MQSNKQNKLYPTKDGRTVFYGGTLTPSQIGSMQINRDEISEFRFFDAELSPMDMSVFLRNRVRKAWEQVEKGNGIYLENQEEK